MIEALLWCVLIILFLLSFVGLLVPIIPSILFLWAGFFIHHFFIRTESLSFFFWIGMGTFSVLLLLADFIANAYFVKKYGGTKWGNRAAFIGLLIGPFVWPPFGLLILPFVAVFMAEYLQIRDLKRALLVAGSSLAGFLSSTIAKVLIQLMMIAWFLIEVFV